VTAPLNPARLTRRARLQLVLALACAGLTVLAIAVPMWIEEFTGLEPDGGGGALEWALAIPFATAAVALGGLTVRTRGGLRPRPGAAWAKTKLSRR
jgi:hypothetical protein